MQSPAALLTGIIDPSRSIEPRYMAYTANLKTGQSLYGLVAAETANSVVMRLPDNSERILKRTNIQSLTSTEKSAMPAGLETGMSEQDMADLLAWLGGELGG